MPHRKVSVAALAGALVTIGLWLAHVLLDVEPPAEVAAAGVVLISFVASYLVPEADQA